MRSFDPVVYVAPSRSTRGPVDQCRLDDAMRTLSQLLSTSSVTCLRSGVAVYGIPPNGLATETNPTMPIHTLGGLFCCLTGPNRGLHARSRSVPWNQVASQVF